MADREALAEIDRLIEGTKNASPANAMVLPTRFKKGTTPTSLYRCCGRWSKVSTPSRSTAKTCLIGRKARAA
jgi:hypothetical protein